MKKLLLLIISALSISVSAQFGGFNKKAKLPLELQAFDRGLKDSMFLNKTDVTPGDTIKLLVEVKIKKDWIVYWRTSGGISSPMNFQWKLPEGIKFEKIEFPYPKYKFDKVIGSGSFYNQGDAKYIATFSISKDAPKGDAKIGMLLNWQACMPGGQCIQEFTGPKLYESSFKISDKNTINKDNSKLFEEGQTKLPLEAPNNWQLHTYKTKQNIKGPYDDAPIEKDVAIVTLKAPTPLDKKLTMFFPTSEVAHAQTIDHETIQLDDNKIQRTYELDSEMLASFNELAGVVTVKNDDKTLAYQLQAKVSDKPLASAGGTKAASKSSTSYRGLSGENISDKKNKGIFYNLVLAFLGGFILNLMPCVFPVLSIKVMGFVNHAKEGKGHGIMHAGIFTLGVLISFWILAGLTLGLKSTNQDVTWGFQLQSPYMMYSLVALLLALSLNLFGVFEIGVSLTSAGQSVQGKTGLYGSFMSGVLATVVATPCMAPMLGAALAFAFTQPPAIAMIFFTAIGLGLSSPYLFLAIFPKFLKFIPKPGAWMETFKQAMGFLMLLAVVWLMDTLQSLIAEQDKFLNVLWSFVALSTALWLYGKYSPMYVEKSKKIKGILAATLLALAAVSYGFSKLEEKTVLTWEKFDPAKLEQYVKDKQPVFIDFTAKWCATCQVNKKLAIYPNTNLFLKKKVILMKADNTKHNEVINKWLDKFNSPGVPLNLLYDGENEAPVKFPETFTKGMLEEQLNKL
ncbi:MAG: thioredoxin family protein [Lentisphaeraceae bacterium]|nr:thioredoxin family protein [Lentisphaeraceae bacterium]